MIFLLLSITCSTIIAIVFRKFKDFEIDTFQAIIYNYIVCLIVGSLILGELPVKGEFWTTDWFPYAFSMGVVFITSFLFIARTIQTFGISITAVVQRMSLLIAVVFAILVFDEAVTTLKVIGIGLALVAVILSSPKPNQNDTSNSISKWLFLLPISVFLLSGGIECVLQYVQKTMLNNDAGQLQFTTFLFGTAAFFGVIALIFNLSTKRMTFQMKHLIGGVALGVPNFGSIYFLLKALDTDWDSSVVLPINNIGVLLVSSLVAVLLFREKLTKWNILGIAFAIAAILLMTISQA